MHNPMIEKEPRGLLTSQDGHQQEGEASSKLFYTQFPIHWLSGICILGWAITFFTY